MKTFKTKTATIMIVVFFIFSMTASTTLIPTANAHNPHGLLPPSTVIL